jgi:hypothetical protein
MVSTLVLAGLQTWYPQTLGCYQFECVEDAKVVIVVRREDSAVHGNFESELPNTFESDSAERVVCEYDGQVLEVPGFTGSITCPPAAAFCHDECPNLCSGHGTCYGHDGTCTCNNGFAGADCSRVSEESEECNEEMYKGLARECQAALSSMCKQQLATITTGAARKLALCGEGSSSGGATSCGELMSCVHRAAELASCGDHVDPLSAAAELNPSFHKVSTLCAADTAEIMAANGGEGDGSCIAGTIREAQDTGCR